MSALAAVFHSDDRQADAASAQAMTSAMAYRGADGIRHWHGGPAALGHCAFHTTAEDGDAQQPLTNARGNLVVCLDGYLTNYDDLRRDLTQRGARLRNTSDAELVLHAYEAWGDDCVLHLDGEFAIVVHDAAARSIFCACDHLGLRQLYYHWDGATLLAATDIAGILAALPDRPSPNLPYMAEHTADCWYTDSETPWQGIMRLPKAHALHLSAGEPRLREYWQLPAGVTIHHKSDADYIEHYRAVLTQCVTDSARTHVPLACDVSGGLDSSAIFCLADKLYKEGTLPAPDLLGFTLSAPEGSWADEREYVKAVEQKTGRQIAAVDLFCPDLDWFTQQGRQDHRLPFLPNTVMLRGVASVAAEAGCRVNLVGQGGDQWLDGQPHHIRQAIRMGDWNALGRNLRADLRGMGPAWTIRQILRQSVTAAIPDRVRAAILRFSSRTTSGTEEHIGLLTPPMRKALAERKRGFARRLADYAPDDQLKQIKLTSPFASLVYDMMNLQTAQVGIEYRHPMLSRKFIEFSAATPEHIRWRGGTTKYVHRQAMKGILPDSIVERQDKAHFSQTFVPHLSDMQQFCLMPSENNSLTKVVVTEAMAQEFTISQSLPIDELPIWTLWGCYAVAAFLADLGSENQKDCT